MSRGAGGFRAALVGANRWLEACLAKQLLKLPDKTLVALSMSAPVVVDGQTLHPQMQFMLRSRERLGNPMRLWVGSVARSRALMRESSRLFSAGVGTGVTARDRVLQTERGRLPVRLYTSGANREDGPLLLFFHGGGFVLGDLDSHDGPCRLLCDEAGVNVLAVDYPLAPEHPFPRAVDDALAAYRALRRSGGEQLGLRPSHVTVGGDSAGGNLATVVAQQVRSLPCPPPDLQLLIYPPTDRFHVYRSWELFRDGFLLRAADGERFNHYYLNGREDLLGDPRVSPNCQSDLRGVCPAIVVTAAFDPLRDEGEAYAQRLESAGVRVVAVREPGLIHGFINMIGGSPAALAATRRIAALLRDQLPAL